MNHEQQAESYAKAVTKNETYREYLTDAFLAGVEATKDKTMNITKEALIERGFDENKTHSNAYELRQDNSAVIIGVKPTTVFMSQKNRGEIGVIELKNCKTLEQLDSLIEML